MDAAHDLTAFLLAVGRFLRLPATNLIELRADANELSHDDVAYFSSASALYDAIGAHHRGDASNATVWALEALSDRVKETVGAVWRPASRHAFRLALRAEVTRGDPRLR